MVKTQVSDIQEAIFRTHWRLKQALNVAPETPDERAGSWSRKVEQEIVRTVLWLRVSSQSDKPVPENTLPGGQNDTCSSAPDDFSDPQRSGRDCPDCSQLAWKPRYIRVRDFIKCPSN